MFDRVRMVLVNTSHPGNIGASARALKNMGLSRLVLVDPVHYPSEQAIWRAANALDVMDKIQVVDSLEAAVADCALVIGTSARERRIPWPMLTPRECGDRVWHEAQKHEVALVFGREDRGLTNEELQLCHYHVHIPANPEYSALNIASALQVLAYEIRISALSENLNQPLSFDEWDMPLADSTDLEHFYVAFESLLNELGFISADNPRQTMTRLRRLFNRVRMDKMELGILRGVVSGAQNRFAQLAEAKKQLEDTLANLKGHDNT